MLKAHRAFPRRFATPAVGCCAILLVHGLLLAWSAFSNSVTYDEFAHLPAGVSYWRSGKFDVYDLSPPLLRLCGSWPAVLAGAHAPAVAPYLTIEPRYRHWDYADAFMHANESDYQKLFLLGRLAMIPISLVGGWITFLWSSRLYGPFAGVISCALYALCPNILAHGSIVGTDVGTAVAFLAACWLWWRYCSNQSWGAWVLATVVIAAALLCKFTSMLLWPAMLVIAAITLPRDRKCWTRLVIGYIASALTCIVLINAAYGFEHSFRRLSDYHFYSDSLARIQSHLPAALPVPLPKPLVEGFDMQKREIELGQPGFLLGESYTGAKWYYYPIALFCKTPLATMVLLAWALGSFLGRVPPRRPRASAELVCLAIPALFLFITMFFLHTDLGVRYVLPILPFLFVFAGRLASSSRTRIFTIALLAVLLVENLAIAPRYLTFFNPLVGGPSMGQRILNDSNYDWGQSLFDLKRWMIQNHVPRVHLGYFGRVDPAIYGIDYDLLNRPSREPFIAISSYFLQGLPHRLPSHQGMTGITHIEFFRELRNLPPVATAGTISIYRRDQIAQAIRAYQAHQH